MDKDIPYRRVIVVSLGKIFENGDIKAGPRSIPASVKFHLSRSKYDVHTATTLDKSNNLLGGLRELTEAV